MCPPTGGLLLVQGGTHLWRETPALTYTSVRPSFYVTAESNNVDKPDQIAITKPILRTPPSGSDDECDTPDYWFRKRLQSSGKKVSFADHHGLRLARIRPLMSQDSLDDIIAAKFGFQRDPEQEIKMNQPHWRPTFSQPAADYLQFRERLQASCVALENVMMAPGVFFRMHGTVKVKNIAFQKQVFIRFTTDDWKTHTDHTAKHSYSCSRAQDTFSFELVMSKHKHEITQLQFCVCYVVNGCEFWDNNNNQNYTIESEPGLVNRSQSM